MGVVNAAGLLFARQRLWESPSPSWRIETVITEHEAEAPLGYPEIHYLTSSLRAASVRAGDPLAVNVWAGSGFQRPSPLRSSRSSRV